MLEKKLLILRVKGGYGNQLFQLSSALIYSNQFNLRIVIDTHSGFRSDWKYRRRFELALIDRQFYRIPKFLSQVAYIFYRIGLFSNINDNSYAVDLKNNFLKKSFVYYMDGYFQNGLYLLDEKGVLRAEIASVVGFKRCCLRVDYIAIHYRGFSSVDSYDDELLAAHFREGISFFKNKLPGRKFMIFTDLQLDDLPEYIRVLDCELDDSSNPVVTMHRLSKYKYCLMSASTFSWWSHVSACNEEKISLFPQFIIEGVGRWNPVEFVHENWKIKL